MVAVAVGIVLAGGWFVVDRYFLPAGTVELDQDAPAGDVAREGQLPVDRAVDILARIMATRAWDRPEFKTRAKVT